MRNIVFKSSIVLFAAALTVACAQSTTSPSSPSAVAAPPSNAQTSSQLEGEWTLASIQVAGQPKQARPVDATYTISFSQGRLSTHVDCNQCSGSYSVSGSSLTAGPNLACTRAACPTMAFENAYEQILSGSSDMVVTNSTLTLTSTRGTLQFVRN